MPSVSPSSLPGLDGAVVLVTGGAWCRGGHHLLVPARRGECGDLWAHGSGRTGDRS